MAEAHFIGQILGAKDFFPYKNLFCKVSRILVSIFNFNKQLPLLKHSKIRKFSSEPRFNNFISATSKLFHKMPRHTKGRLVILKNKSEKMLP